MRAWCAVFALTAAVSVVAAADEKPARDKEDPSKKAGKLGVGDEAPALKASKWLQGKEVTSFEKGKVYVVEFWATWCGPCIVMMPHLGDLQEQYRSKGVTIIGYSAKDPNNSEEKVTEFVKKRGAKLGYTFAYADDRDTYNAWMRAAGQNGIPCSFVVDRESKIAYIGHPMFLDVVLPGVVAGTWKGKDSLAEVKKVEDQVNGVFASLRGGNAEKALAAITSFEKKNPAMANVPYFVGPKLSGLVEANKTAEARKLAEALLAKAVSREDTGALGTLARSLRSEKAKEDKDLLALAVKAAEAGVKVSGDKDAIALYNLAETYLAAGNREKAKETAKMAIENAAPNLKRFLEQRLKPILEEKQD